MVRVGTALFGPRQSPEPWRRTSLTRSRRSDGCHVAQGDALPRARARRRVRRLRPGYDDAGAGPQQPRSRPGASGLRAPAQQRRAVGDRRGAPDRRAPRESGAGEPATARPRPPAPAAGGAADPVTPNAKPHVVVPTSFNQAQEVADKFKGNQPVIMNLQGADRDLSRRLIDFASGLCYGLGGQMERSPTRCTCSPPPTSRCRPRSAAASTSAATTA